MRPMIVALTAATLLLAGCGATAQTLPTATTARAVSAQAAKAPELVMVGHVVEVNFGQAAFDLEFHSATKMTYRRAGGPNAGAGETVAVQIKPIRPGVFMLTWVESDGTTVVHVEDYEQGVVFTNITASGGQFIQWHGTLKIVK